MGLLNNNAFLLLPMLHILDNVMKYSYCNTNGKCRGSEGTFSLDTATGICESTSHPTCTSKPKFQAHINSILRSLCLTGTIQGRFQEKQGGKPQLHKPFFLSNLDFKYTSLTYISLLMSFFSLHHPFYSLLS